MNTQTVPGSRFLTVMACGLASALLVSAPTEASGPITEFPVPTESSFPAGITAGPDGNVWFTESGGMKIGRVTPQGSITEFPTTSPPYDITVGSDGNLWYAAVDLDYGLNQAIGRVSPSGEVKEFKLSAPACGIAAGPDGNLWFTSCRAGSNAIGRAGTDGAITMFSLPSSLSGQHFPYLIAAGPDGNLWYTVPITRQIGRITIAGAITEFPLPAAPGRNPTSIVAGPGGLWFIDGDKIGRITTGGEVAEFDVPAFALGLGPDGNLWIASSDKIGRLSIVADRVDVQAELVIPTASPFVAEITSGPDGNLWFTEGLGNNIGRVDMSGVCAANALCLGDRFQVTAAWEGGGQSGLGKPTSLTGNAGYFWFFGPSNIEVFVKILDACTASGKFNVYVNGLTHLGVTVTVTDTRTGTSKQYVNPTGSPFSLIFDGSTFACP